MFLELLQLAVGNRTALSRMPSPQEWRHIYEEAAGQAVQGLIAEAALSLHPQCDKALLLTMYAGRMQLQQANRAQTAAIGRLISALRQAEVPAVVVKGQTIGACYPNPLLRVPGDIDVYIPDYERHKERIEQALHITLPARSFIKEYPFHWQGQAVEIHSHLVVWASAAHQRYWERSLAESLRRQETIDLEGTAVPVLDPTLNVVYVLVHLFFHLVKEGIGLRQVCDLAILLHFHRERIDRPRLRQLLQGLGVERAFEAFGRICVEDLGLPAAELPVALTPCTVRFRRLIWEDIERGGNFGKKQRQHVRSHWGNKWMTFRTALRNLFRYYRLAPAELLLFLWKRLRMNLYDRTLFPSR